MSTSSPSRAKKKTERRTFKEHAKLFADMIMRQAGTLEKSILEAVMNAVDARATMIDITLNLQDGLRVRDDGRGFRSKAEIKKFFEIFGQPHEESEQKIFGEFRMGRGQLFAYGVNTWRSGRFEMVVDILQHGRSYELRELDEHVNGCDIHVDLYEQGRRAWDQWQLDYTLRQLSQWVEYVETPIFVNGSRVNPDPKPTLTPDDLQTEHGFLKTATRNTLRIFNQGVFVCERSASMFGVGGDLVTNKPVQVNFARNDIQSACPIWQELQTAMMRRYADDLATKRVLTEDERVNLLQRLASDSLEWSDRLSRHVKLFPLVNGQWLSATSLRKLLSRSPAIGFAKPGDTEADTIHNAGLAVVLSDALLGYTGMKTDAFLKWLRQTPAGSYNMTAAEMSSLRSQVNSSYTTVPENEWTKKERTWIEFLQSGLADVSRHGGDRDRRRVRLGLHPSAQAWTDGHSHITFNRKTLDCPMNLRHLVHLGTILIHEVCHDESNMDTHVHGLEFYRQFEELCIRGLPWFVEHRDRTLRMRITTETKRRQKGKTPRDMDAAEEYVAALNAEPVPET